MKREKFTFWPGFIPATPHTGLTRLRFLSASAAVVLLLLACTGRDSETTAGQRPAVPVSAVKIAARGEVSPSDTEGNLGPVGPRREVTENIPRLLEEIAELERAGALQRGMGFIESELREKAGDYAGAVLAAVREMARSYGYGEIQKNDLEQGLDRAIALEGQGNEPAVQAALALRAFFAGRWDEAEQMLAVIFPEIEEPDDFTSWLLLSCTLEKNRDDKRASSAYKAIRTRYAQFPEYWYRGAKFFSGSIASEYAERCINIAPEGPFAPECRSILASSAGLNAEDGASIRSKLEIEGCVTQSVRSGNPKLL
jgi:hypothetical protein